MRAGDINCDAGYEFAIARQAVTRNPRLKLYGLQWGAPGWVGRNGSLFTSADIRYLLGWLGCTRRHDLTVSYLGGWNERDHHGSHGGWYRRLRAALDAGGFGGVRIVAGDSGLASNRFSWEYPASRAVAIMGAHNNCGRRTGGRGPRTRCTSTGAARKSGKPLWASELGAMDAGAQSGCHSPCAPAMDRAFTREYIDARVTGVLTWPAIDSMPAAALPYENRGLLSAKQPWSGSYHVNAMTWAIAQITQFVSPPTATNPGGWRYVNSASGYLQGGRADGSYVTLVRSTRNQWSTIIETTADVTRYQRARFTVTGGDGLAGRTVHVWSSNFSRSTAARPGGSCEGRTSGRSTGSSPWPSGPGYVYSLTTTTGQGKGTASGPAARPLPRPYHNGLSAGHDEPAMLAAQDGSFELAPCHAPDGSTTCAEQTTPARPTLWVDSGQRHPYAIIGNNWANYVLTVDVMLPQPGSAGLIGRYHAKSAAHGSYDAYVFNASTNGTFTLKIRKGGTAADTISGAAPAQARRLPSCSATAGPLRRRQAGTPCRCRCPAPRSGPASTAVR